MKISELCLVVCCSLIKLHNKLLPKPNQLYKFELLPNAETIYLYYIILKFKTIMKKNTFICCLGFLFTLMACDTGDFEQDPNLKKHSSDALSTSVPSKPARTDLAFITQRLTESYLIHVDDTNTTTSQKIELLDSASLYVPLFNSLKPTDYTLPTATEAALFLTDYQNSYINLNVSSLMKSYLDVLVLSDTVDYIVLTATIDSDISLTDTEKVQLRFIITYLSENDGDPIEDVTWSKKRIVAAVEGFSKSSANAVFNVALVKVAE